MEDIKKADLILSLKDGADIFLSSDARKIMDVFHAHPKFLDVVSLQGEYAHHKRSPYFGYIATEDGISWANSVGKISIEEKQHD